MKKNEKVFAGELVIVRCPHQRDPDVTRFFSFEEAWNAYVASGLVYTEYASKAEVLIDSGIDEDDEEAIDKLRERLSEFSHDEPIVEADTAMNGDLQFYSAAKFTKEDALYEAARDDMSGCVIVYAATGETYGHLAERVFDETRGHNAPTMSAIVRALCIDDWDDDEE